MTSISLQNVSVNFPIYGISSRSLKKQLIRISTGGKFGATDSHIINIKALDNISVNIDHGDRIGLIGHNGSGKSTLLKVIAGICEPSAGSSKIDGKVSALLDVMLGMDPESTGYENIMLRGAINGFTRKEILAKKNAIAEFTELGDYLSLPVRTYSSGMQLRLAFGIATAIFPEILVLDEIVGTGDASFMKKAQERLEHMFKTSHIVVLASHDLNIIEKFCNKLLWLDAGKVAFYGEIAEGLQKYMASCKN
jgi:lipopolysaccharide transport system ATP-binding protein